MIPRTTTVSECALIGGDLGGPPGFAMELRVSEQLLASGEWPVTFPYAVRRIARVTSLCVTPDVCRIIRRIRAVLTLHRSLRDPSLRVGLLSQAEAEEAVTCEALCAYAHILPQFGADGVALVVATSSPQVLREWLRAAGVPVAGE